MLGAVAWSLARRREASGYGVIASAASGATIGWLLLGCGGANESWTNGAYIAVPLGATVAMVGLERVVSNVRLCAISNGCLAYLCSVWLVFRVWCRKVYQSIP